MLGWELDTLLDKTLQAMKTCEDKIEENLEKMTNSKRKEGKQ